MSATLLEIFIAIALIYVAIRIGVILAPTIILRMRRLWNKVEDPEGNSIIVEVQKPSKHEKDKFNGK